MDKKYFLLVAVLVLIVAGVLWVRKTDKVTMTNGSMLQTQNTAPIVTENSTYFPEANGYFARPKAKGSYPGVVLIHENRGLRNEIKGMADQLAKEGFLVLAVDLFGKVVETQDEARKLTAEFNQQKGIENMRAAVAYLKGKGATKIASLGWCFGGAQSLQLALSGETMDATLLYYGRLGTITPERFAPIKWPVLGIFGGADTGIPVESVNQFDATLDQLGIENEFYIYPGVGHAFANPSGMNYAPEETKDAWEKTTAFLKKHLASQ
ncbi:MAG TPA: dienelactone hydrolase family protein [Patescibacteria group bacterium]|nr:dienelactone hydrolase family protein [Patescibacteria group bacterium]